MLEAGSSNLRVKMKWPTSRHCKRSVVTTFPQTLCEQDGIDRYGWQRPFTKRQIAQAVMMFKIESLWDKFRQRCHISNCNTRNCRNLEIPKTNLEKTKKGFHQTGIRVWNNVPNEVRELPLIHQFEKNLKNTFSVFF